MNLELYKTFYYVANHGNISKAAASLYITQPAVSRAVHQLEDELGCTLFSRTSKGVKLTYEGKALYQHMDQVFRIIAAAEKNICDIKNISSGEIRIGVSDTLCKYYLVPFLKLFNTFHPDIKIHVICPTTPGIIMMLKAGKIDFGIINMPYYDQRLAVKVIMKIQDCFIVGEKYRHLHYTMQPLNELIKYPFILLERNSNTRLFIDRYFLNNSVSVIPAFELGNIDLLVHFARYDFGIACVIRNFIEDDLDKGHVYEIQPIEKIPHRSVGVVWLKDVCLSAASSEFISLLDSSEVSEI